MDIHDEDYNTFARALTGRFVKRAMGTDDASRRLVGVQPADQILAGFLTPGGTAVDPEPDEELPQDGHYEQTSLGLEWRVDEDQLLAGRELDIVLYFRVFVRRLAKYEEVSQALSWRRTRGVEPPVETAEPAGAWTREELGPIALKVDSARLVNQPVQIELASQVIEAWSNVDKDRLYPGRVAQRLRRENAASSEAYEQWCTSLGSDPSPPLPIEWRPIIDVRLIQCPNEAGVRRIALRVLNRTQRPSPAVGRYVDPNLYAIDLSVSMNPELHRPSFFKELPDSFRFDREMPGVGINSHVQAKLEEERLTLSAHPIPVTETPRLVPRSVPDAAPNFQSLMDDPVPLLAKILADMERYSAEDWADKVSQLAGIEKAEALTATRDFAAETLRFKRGIELLGDTRYPHVLRAFRLMNEAMKNVAKGYDEWRLFQIVFIVSQIPSLASRQHEELWAEEDDVVDVLWFAAGGGKTEAFLGLILWQCFFDRLRGKEIGVSTLVRFPLRLLGFQQFGRISRALAAAELIRKREALGGARFSLGFFAGAQVTPNSIDNEAHARFQRKGVPEEFQLVTKCPFCASSVRLEYNGQLRLIEHWCDNKTCPGGLQRLPIYVVDRDVYHFLPTAIVSTVDKLAQLGQNQRFGNLLGRISAVCPIHGATFDGIDKNYCEAAAHSSSDDSPPTCGGRPVRSGPFHDAGPSLLVQDEMHLLAEDLGAFDAHYETAAAEMSKSLGMRPWKIVGATATIEDYSEHSWQLYLKKSRRFPGPGPESDASFYYGRDPSLIGRIFVGVLGVGRKHTPIVSRALTLLYWELQQFRRLAQQDPDKACAFYGLRALGREELSFLTFLYELPLTYVLTRKGSDQVSEAIESRVKKDLQEVAPDHGELLVRTFNSGVDVADMMAAMETIERDTADGDPEQRIRGLVATSIIGHGVDVDRFNLMVFAGFTRLVAEYIQASARVGRTFPGISILAVTPQSERDRSIFDRFGKFHEYLDRLVDPSAVNRWSTPAMRRTLPGILSGYFMTVAANELQEALWSVEGVQGALGRPGAESLNGDPCS